MHCEGIMSGELKHGPLAMVDDSLPIVMVITKDPVYTVIEFFVIILLGHQFKFM